MPGLRGLVAAIGDAEAVLLAGPPGGGRRPVLPGGGGQGGAGGVLPDPPSAGGARRRPPGAPRRRGPPANARRPPAGGRGPRPRAPGDGAGVPAGVRRDLQAEHERFYAGPAAAQVGSRPVHAGRTRHWPPWPGSAPSRWADDRVKVDRILAAAAPPPCHRRLDLELSWKPRVQLWLRASGRCRRPFDADAVAAMADRGVREHLGELHGPSTGRASSRRSITSPTSAARSWPPTCARCWPSSPTRRRPTRSPWPTSWPGRWAPSWGTCSPAASSSSAATSPACATTSPAGASRSVASYWAHRPCGWSAGAC